MSSARVQQAGIVMLALIVGCADPDANRTDRAQDVADPVVTDMPAQPASLPVGIDSSIVERVPVESERDSIGVPETQDGGFVAYVEGIEVYRGEPETGGGVSFSVIRVDPARHEIGIATSDDVKTPGLSILTYQKKHDASIVLSGGFLKSFNPPLPEGLLKVDGRVINGTIESELLNGVLALRRDRVAIMGIDDLRSLEDWDDALQSGPLLVASGWPVVAGIEGYRETSTRIAIADAFVRAFVGIDSEGRILLGYTEPIGLLELLRIASIPLQEGGFGATSLLNLSGHSSAGLVVGLPGLRLQLGNLMAPLPSALFVRSRH